MSLYKGTTLISGHQVLYSSIGQNTDGAMTQKATTDILTYSNVGKVSGVVDTNHVLSNFSASSYASIPEKFDPSTNTWEIVFKVNSGSDLTGEQYFLGTGGINSAKDNVILGFSNSVMYTILASDTSTSIGSITGTTTIVANTDYTVKLEFTGSAYNLYVDDNLEGSLQSSVSIYASTLLIGIQSSSNGVFNYPWRGTVDLKHSYININGSRWWNGVESTASIDELPQIPEFRYGKDGQWIYSAYTIASGVTYPTSDHTNYSLSSYLPKDGYKYEVLIRGSVTTGTTSGNSCVLYLQSDILTGYGLAVCGTRTRTTSSVPAYGTVLLPVGVQRKVTVVSSSGAVGTYAMLAMGYRRIGTNI